MIRKFLKWLWKHVCYRFIYEHPSGYYRTERVYSKYPRWWLVKWDALKERRRRPYFLSSAPGVRISPVTIERRRKTHFDKCDQVTEVLLTLKNMEAAGQLKTPEARAAAEAKREEVLSNPPPVIDYQVHGHPNFDKDFKHPAFTNRGDYD